ncbi:MAG: DEAD/DEAH box helicase [Actinomycetota bacterium]|nr:DEAD/DEAH box helicase [Actinomycetota bacterium]
MPDTFDQLGLPEELVLSLSAQGIDKAFPIQALTIGDALAGRDVCGKAKTGSGKTLAFGLPLLARLSPGRRGVVQGLVLVPTRELAIQVAAVLKPLANAVGRSVACVYGGVSVETQLKGLKKEGCDVVVATPGRLIDLQERGQLALSELRMLVLDEADRMSDMGFMPQVEWLLRKCPQARQTMLFSATLDGDVDHLVRHYMNDPVRHEVSEAQVTVEAMVHRFLSVHQMDKARVAAAIVRACPRTILFVRTKRGADVLVRSLNAEGVKAAAFHGDLHQKEREQALASFAQGKLSALVATDVAARGIHVDSVGSVIHYDPPEDHKSYLHRSGRTARAGERGLVVTLVLWNQVMEVERIQRRLGLRAPIVEVFSNDSRLHDLASWQPGEDAA